MTVRATVIVPTYNTGAPLQRLVESLDAQTLPTDEFEAVFVDDGSTDDTADRLELLCASRPNYRTTRIANSGWPGRPRNIGLDMATGDYVFFCDHDDYLAADALERMHEYAVANDSDIVIGREVRVGRQPLSNALFRANRPRADLSWSPLLNLMTPHKLFRRAFLTENGLRFPEGKRRLEDHALVLPAYFRAKNISVLADTPCYFWVMKAAGDVTHSSKGIDPETYYPHLEEVLDVVEANTEPGPFRDQLLSHWYRGKVIGFIGRSIRKWEPERQEALLAVTSELARTRFTGVDPYLVPIKRLQSALLRADRIDELVALTAALTGLSSTPAVRSATWQDGELVLEVSTALRDASGAPLLFRRAGDRTFWVPSVALGDGIDEALLELTEEVSAPRAVLQLREPRSGVHHELEGDVAAQLEPVEGGYALSTTTTFRLNPQSLAYGRPLDPGHWRARLRVSLGGLDSVEDLPSPAPLPGPALLDGRAVVPHTRSTGGFALAMSAADKPLAGAARPRPQDVSVRHTVNGSRLRIELTRVHVRGGADLPAALHIGGLPVPARLVADGSRAYVDSWLSALPGTHRLKLAVGGGKAADLRLALRVSGDGRVTAERPVQRGAKRPPAVSYPHVRAAVRRVPGLAAVLRRLRPAVTRLRTRGT